MRYLTLLPIVFFANESIACGCTLLNSIPASHQDSRQNSPQLIFTAISGDALLSDKSSLDTTKENWFTKVKVVEALTSKREVGETFEVSQKVSLCSHSFLEGKNYVLYFDKNQNIERIGYCTVAPLAKAVENND